MDAGKHTSTIFQDEIFFPDSSSKFPRPKKFPKRWNCWFSKIDIFRQSRSTTIAHYKVMHNEGLSSKNFQNFWAGPFVDGPNKILEEKICLEILIQFPFINIFWVKKWQIWLFVLQLAVKATTTPPTSIGITFQPKLRRCMRHGLRLPILRHRHKRNQDFAVITFKMKTLS